MPVSFIPLPLFLCRFHCFQLFWAQGLLYIFVRVTRTGAYLLKMISPVSPLSRSMTRANRLTLLSSFRVAPQTAGKIASNSQWAGKTQGTAPQSLGMGSPSCL